MTIFEKLQGTLVPIHEDNANSKDWLILLEAATIVGNDREKLRVGLVPLTGPEIGQLMAKALEGGAIEKAPWYAPVDALPADPVIKPSEKMEFDSLVADAPVAKTDKATPLRAVGSPEKS